MQPKRQAVPIAKAVPATVPAYMLAASFVLVLSIVILVISSGGAG